MKIIKLIIISTGILINLSIKTGVIEKLYSRDNMYHDVKIEVYKQSVIPHISWINLTVRIKNRTDKPICLLQDSFYGLPLISKEQLQSHVLSGVAFLNSRRMSAAQFKDTIHLLGTAVGSGFFGWLISRALVRYNYNLFDNNLLTITGTLIPFLFYDKFNNAEKKAAQECERKKNDILHSLQSELLFDPPLTIQPGELKQFDLYFEMPAEDNKKLFIDIYTSEGELLLKGIQEI